ACGVGGTRQQVGGIELGADVGFCLPDACKRLIVNGQGLPRIAVAENVTDFQPVQYHGPAAQIIEGVHLREVLTDIESPLESRERLPSAAEARFRILLS